MSTTKSGIQMVSDEAKNMSELHRSQEYDELDTAELQDCAEAYLVAANSIVGSGGISIGQQDDIEAICKAIGE